MLQCYSSRMVTLRPDPTNRAIQSAQDDILSHMWEVHVQMAMWITDWLC